MALSQGVFYKLPGTSFITDLMKVEFLADKVRLKNLLEHSTFGATYNTNINGTWGDGDLIGTPFGGASVLNGALDLAHNDVRYVDYNANLNADSQQTGCFRFKVTPNYTGGPAVTQYFFNIGSTSLLKNRIIFYHIPDKTTYLTIHNNTNGRIVMIGGGVWDVVAGQEYEIEIDFDITNGETRIFIDGIQQGVTATDIGIRDNDISILRIGNHYGSTALSNFKINYFIVFDEVQHTTNYIPSGCNTPYQCGGVSIMVNSAIECDDIEELADLVHTAGGSDNVRFSFDVNGTQKYYSGGNWVNSDGTYSQSNNYADLTSTVLAELLTTASRVKLIAFLYSADGSTTPTLTSVIVYYDFGVPDIPVVNSCIVWGWLKRSNGEKEGIKVRANLGDSSVYNSIVLVTSKYKEVVTDDRGYFKIELVNNASMEAGAFYDFDLDGVLYKKIVPDEVSKNFELLVDAP